MVAMLIAASANAATVAPLEDKVAVNRGGGFKTIKQTVEVQPGTRVMTGPTGRATIAYGDACVVTIEPGQLVTVPAKPPCEAAPFDATVYYVAGGLIVAGGVGAAAILLSDDDNPASP